MRGFCPECHNEIDETEYIIKEKMCRDCFNKKKGDVVYTEDEIAQLLNGEIEPETPEPKIGWTFQDYFPKEPEINKEAILKDFKKKLFAPIPDFWKASIKLGKATELEYYSKVIVGQTFCIRQKSKLKQRLYLRFITILQYADYIKFPNAYLKQQIDRFQRLLKK